MGKHGKTSENMGNYTNTSRKIWEHHRTSSINGDFKRKIIELNGGWPRWPWKSQCLMGK
jgi:hypothetical protein